jgi:hypothetical protein
LLAALRDGPAGVARWNARSPADRARAGGPGPDLSGAALDGAELRDLAFPQANCDGASLANARLDDSDFRHASFRKADLTEAALYNGRFRDADFTGACLTGCFGAHASFRRATFKDASLAGADLGRADLCGADLSSADLTGAQLEGARYDEKTRFPRGFQPPKQMKWAGKGANPYLPRISAAQAENLDFPAFLARLRRAVDPARLRKALEMLREGPFQLYAHTSADAVVGMVKSQTDPGLIYPCRLASDGSFSCCTQNLHACGGLRGAVCKHILLLVVGLTKAGRLAPGLADAWVSASSKQLPSLDRAVMTDVLIQYRGAEAGQIDWRPTETIPEDYYTL